jgi:DNA-binding CsgD family transcriptional regulator
MLPGGVLLKEAIMYTIPKLTAFEKKILLMVLKGKSPQEMAAGLSRSVRKIEEAVSALRAKTGAVNLAEEYARNCARDNTP